jgi:hypothetical protein
MSREWIITRSSLYPAALIQPSEGKLNPIINILWNKTILFTKSP